jgi:hypothetical protein
LAKAELLIVKMKEEKDAKDSNKLIYAGGGIRTRDLSVSQVMNPITMSL